MAKKTRSRLKWALDYDYLSKLSPDEKAWLEKFSDEYYRNELSEEPLHATPEQRGSTYEANNASVRDIRVASKAQVAEHRSGLSKYRPCHRIRIYDYSDWALTSSNPEDNLLELIDENKKASGATIIQFPSLGTKRLAS